MLGSVAVSANSGSSTFQDAPFFTVLLPTMNRPALFPLAAESVLQQTFGDFELLISDNSSDEDAVLRNRTEVNKYVGDRRVRYIRPPQWMSMPDHLEFASRHALGRFVVVLTDRFVMRPSALQYLHTQIAQLPDDCGVISWHVDSELSRSGILHTAPFTGATEVAATLSTIRDFAKLRDWRTTPLWSNRLPRMLNTCFRSSVASEVREKYGRLFMPLLPDYTCAFLLLASSERVAHIDRPLYLNHGDQSNGQQFLLFEPTAYMAALGDVDVYLDAPAHVLTATNLIMRDFLMVKQLVGRQYADIALDTMGYFLCNYREFLQMERLGSQRDLAALYAQWWAAVANLPDEEQARIKSGVEEMKKQRQSLIPLRRLIVRMGLHAPIHVLRDYVRRIGRMISGGPIYLDALDAAKRTDDFVTEARGRFVANGSTL